MTDQITIRIKGYAFRFTKKYQPGMIELSPGEAQALNQTLAENVRNNVFGLVATACEGLSAGEFITPEAERELAESIRDYAENYQFKVFPSPAPKLGHIEREARIIAEHAVDESNRMIGKTRDEDPARENLIEQHMATPKVQQEARIAARLRFELAQQSLFDLFEDEAP